MNERIKELAEQARLGRGPEKIQIRENGVVIFYLDELEKFAQLIVGECVDVLKKDMELAHIQLIPLNFNMYANGRLQRTIKQHFGVEE